MSISGTVPHRAAISFFSSRRLRGSGAASSGVSLMLPSRRSAICSQSRRGSAPCRASELGAHLLAELGDERAWVQRLAEAGVVLGAAGLEVGGQVLVGVAPPVRAGDPDLLAAQVLAQRLEGDDLVDRAHHALAAVLVGAVDQRLPVLGDPGMGRDVLPGRVVGQAARGGVPADQRQDVRLPALGCRLQLERRSAYSVVLSFGLLVNTGLAAQTGFLLFAGTARGQVNRSAAVASSTAAVAPCTP